MTSKFAMITFLDGGPVDPGYGRPVGPGGPVDPGWGVRPPVDPGYGRPGFSPVDPGWGARPPTDPGFGRPVYPNRPDNSLPGFSGHPDNTLPGGGYISGQPVPPPVTPDNTLPPHSPAPTISLPVVLTTPVDPDRYFEMKYSAAYGWVLVPVADEVPAPK